MKAGLPDLLERESSRDLAEHAAQELEADGIALSHLVATHGDMAAGLTEAELRASLDAALFEEQPAADMLTILGRLKRGLDDAAATISGLLSARYPALATDETPPDFMQKAQLDIACYELLGGDEDSARRRAYDATMMTLRAMAEGRVDLYPQSAPEGEGSPVIGKAEPEIFSRNKLAGYRHGH